MDEASHRVHEYNFTWAGEVYACTTHWFLATPLPVDPQPVDDAPFNLGPSWIALEEAGNALGYHPGARDFALAMIAERQ